MEPMETTFTKNIQRFRPILLTLAEAMISPALRGELEASDLVQQTLMEAHHHADKLADTESQPFYAWLRTCLKHNVLDAVKQLKTQKQDVRRRVRSSDLADSFDRLGPTLYDCSNDKSLGPEQIARIMECIARAIDAVHRRGVLHGDIKPHNILIERESNRPLISDFGLAEFDTVAPDGHSLKMAGTPAYMAPELAKAALSETVTDDVVSIRSVSSDIYSLGATLWSALAGCSPCHEGRNQKQQLADVVARNMRFTQRQNDGHALGLRTAFRNVFGESTIQSSHRPCTSRTVVCMDWSLLCFDRLLDRL